MTLHQSIDTSYLSELKLRVGKGTGAPGDRCSVQERRAWTGLDPASDEVPVTDSLVCGRFLIRFQDGIWDDAERNRLCSRVTASASSARTARSSSPR